MSAKIKVGVIGANADYGWGGGVHIPVLGYLPEFEIVAVCTSREESARKSAEHFGVRLAFSDPQEMVSHPDVELVVVAVKAPDHFRLAMMALEAGKHVYCEWPLAANSQQASEMQALAVSKGVKTSVGLQARGAPAINYVRDLVRDGFVGKVIAARLNGALPGAGGQRGEGGRYAIDKAGGAGTLGVQGGHALDTLRFIAGDFVELSALLGNHYKTVNIAETGEDATKTADDQVLVVGALADGVVASASINHEVVAGFEISLNIYGEQGTISLAGNSGMNFMMSELTLSGAQLPDRVLAPLDIPAIYDAAIIPADFKGGQPYPGVTIPRATAVNIANLYRALGQAIRGEGESRADFGIGLSLHHVLDAIETAAATGARQQLT